MSIATTEEYVKRAEECVRLAGACIAESNREILLYVAARWRMLGDEAGPVPAAPTKAMQGSGGLQDADRAQGERG
jgi:hypothetical protein